MTEIRFSRTITGKGGTEYKINGKVRTCSVSRFIACVFSMGLIKLSVQAIVILMLLVTITVVLSQV